MLSLVSFGQQWVAVRSNVPSTISTELLSSSENSVVVKLQVPGFYALEATTPHGEANIISVPKTVSTAQAGEPDLPSIAVPVIIGDQQHYNIHVIDAQYTDFQMEVAPSKGDFSRQVNPEDVPYTYGEAYSTDAFFPAENVGLYDPYILRDFRGQNIVVYPFAYNPISKTLRVYYNMTVELYADRQQGENILNRRSNEISLDSEIKAMYGNHFINYSESLNRYTPVDETGELLIICHDAFMEAMQPFVAWKKQIGRPTTMVGTSTTGTTDSAIKTYIENQYASNSNLTHVLLVGDSPQIPGHIYSNCGNYSGKSDNWYGQVVGSDYYNELIIGRFSAENATQVTTQVNKVIHYERDITASDTWLVNGCGIAATAGSGGHFGEDDWQHINNIRTDLMNYGYSTVYQEYYNTTGYTSTTQQISDRVNSGVSIINYCNHGTYTAWQSHNPYYSNTYVNALTNDNMLPIIFSVACLVGKYDHSQTCFGETWLRATNNTTGNPTGAVAGMFSYISQPWVPPMYGQDEMIDILVENYSTNIKRAMGGISYDGNMKILDQYGQNGGQGLGTYLAWILYGDPTLTVRNAIPTNMNVTHAPSMGSNATNFVVNATNGNGALATLTLNNEILGSATINNSMANITFTAPGTTGTATLTVFGYNKITYEGTINITSGGATQYNVNVSANPTNGGTVTGGGTYSQGQLCTVNATANSGYTFTNWTEDGNVVSSQACYTFSVNNNCNLVANFQAQSYTINVSANPTLGGSVTGGGAFNYGANCTVSATANAGYTFTNWTENGNVVSTNASFSFTVTGNRNLVANFQEIPCEAPSNLTASVAENTITLAWEASSTAVRYRIYRDDLCIANDITALTYTDTNLEFNHQYCYYVTSMCSNGTMSVPTDEVCATTENFDCEAPTNVTAEAINYTDIRINWSGSPTAQSYKIYRNGTLVTSGYPYVGGYYDTELPYGEYCYTIVSECEYGDSDPSEEACVILSIPCNAPASFTANYVYENENDFGVALHWNSVAPIYPELFHLYRMTEMGEYELLADIQPSGSTYNYFDDTQTGTYSYMLTAEYHFDGQICVSEPVYASVEVTNISETSNAISLYPNPTQGEVTLEGEGLQSVRIVNAFGQTIYNAKVEGEQVRIDLSNMAKGVYVMHIGTANGETMRQIMVE